VAAGGEGGAGGGIGGGEGPGSVALGRGADGWVMMILARCPLEERRHACYAGLARTVAASSHRILLRADYRAVGMESGFGSVFDTSTRLRPVSHAGLSTYCSQLESQRQSQIKGPLHMAGNHHTRARW
jgi:hypothetical protein